MRRLLVIYLLSVTGFCFAHSQEQKKSLDDYIKAGSAWIDVRIKTYGNGVYGEYTPGDYYRLYLNYITGDTLIGEYAYLRVATRVWNSDYSYDFCDVADCWFLRTDSLNRLWNFHQKEKKDKLLIDFSRNFEIGDTIRDRDGIKKNVIQNVDTITFMDGSKGLIANNDYIWGIGNCYYSPVGPEEEDIEDGRSWVFLAFIRDGEFLYVRDHLKEILNNDGFVERVMRSFKKDADQILPPTSKDRKEPAAPIYDLTGRRLNSVPEKGIYIQGGKKRVVK